MSNRLFKVIIIYILISIFIFLTSSSMAYSIDNIFTDAKDFLNAGNTVESTISKTELKNTASFIFNLLKAIGIIIAIAVGIVLGIQFMVSSAEDKAKVKEALIAYCISCVVFFSAYRIWVIVISIVQDITE